MNDVAMTDEAVEAAITPQDTPQQAQARKTLVDPRATRRQREAAWLLLKPLKLKAKNALPDDPMSRGFLAQIEKLRPFDRASLTKTAFKWALIGYKAGWNDAEEQAVARFKASDGYKQIIAPRLVESDFIAELTARDQYGPHEVIVGADKAKALWADIPETEAA